MDLSRLMLGGQTMKNLHQLVCEFELDQSQCHAHPPITVQTPSRGNNGPAAVEIIPTPTTTTTTTTITTTMTRSQLKRKKHDKRSVHVSHELLRHLLLLLHQQIRIPIKMARMITATTTIMTMNVVLTE